MDAYKKAAKKIIQQLDRRLADSETYQVILDTDGKVMSTVSLQKTNKDYFRHIAERKAKERQAYLNKLREKLIEKGLSPEELAKALEKEITEGENKNEES